MLLRSSSSPILNLWMPISVSGSLTESEVLPKLIRTRSVCLTTSFDESCGRGSVPIRTTKRIVCDSDFKDSVKPKKGSRVRALPKAGKIPERSQEIVAFSIKNSASEAAAPAAVGIPQPGGVSDEAYYQMMISANPRNALLLANYAKFLKEVKRDFKRAEEYYGRAILEDPGDSHVLALYADLIWQTHRDAERADAYFNQAVTTNPNDCYLLGSYAYFLWDAEDSGRSRSNYAPFEAAFLPQHLAAIS